MLRCAQHDKVIQKGTVKMLFDKSRMANSLARLWLLAFLLPVRLVAQECGRTEVHFSNPEYYTSTLGIIAIEPPKGWFHDTTQKDPFYLIRRGENHENAKTVMYVSVEPLTVTFDEAVRNDVKEFRQSCEKLSVDKIRTPDLLEKGCKVATHVFTCAKKKGSHIDLDTKIAIRGILLNVVLSAETQSEIETYRSDYNYLLQHLASGQ
jgi:hypothetical protein